MVDLQNHYHYTNLDDNLLLTRCLEEATDCVSSYSILITFLLLFKAPFCGC